MRALAGSLVRIFAGAFVAMIALSWTPLRLLPNMLVLSTLHWVMFLFFLAPQVLVAILLEIFWPKTFIPNVASLLALVSGAVVGSHFAFAVWPGVV